MKTGFLKSKLALMITLSFAINSSVALGAGLAPDEYASQQQEIVNFKILSQQNGVSDDAISSKFTQLKFRITPKPGMVLEKITQVETVTECYQQRKYLTSDLSLVLMGAIGNGLLYPLDYISESSEKLGYFKYDPKSGVAEMTFATPDRSSGIFYESHWCQPSIRITMEYGKVGKRVEKKTVVLKPSLKQDVSETSVSSAGVDSEKQKGQAAQSAGESSAGLSSLSPR